VKTGRARARYLGASFPFTSKYSNQRSNCFTEAANAWGKEIRMFKPAQYRAKASEYGELANTSTGSEQKRDFQKLERRFAVLADNEQWLADNYQNTVHADQDRPFDETLADEEERILRCLGAALIMQWNTLPTKLQRELFDNAGAMGELLNTSALRGQIARFLHKRKNDDDTSEPPAAVDPKHFHADDR
jgi:hypothetical protein